MKTPAAGTRVWVFSLTLEDNRGSTAEPVPRATIRERVFYKVIPNCLGKFGVRWSLGPARKRDNTVCVAYMTENVYLTQEEAEAALTNRVNEFVRKLDNLKPTIKSLS